jgi:hypothetical protein
MCLNCPDERRKLRGKLERLNRRALELPWRVVWSDAGLEHRCDAASLRWPKIAYPGDASKAEKRAQRELTVEFEPGKSSGIPLANHQEELQKQKGLRERSSEPLGAN